MPDPDSEIDHLQKLREAIEKGNGLVAANKLTKPDTLKWLVSVRTYIREVFGEKEQVEVQITRWLRDFAATPSQPKGTFVRS